MTGMYSFGVVDAVHHQDKKAAAHLQNEGIKNINRIKARWQSIFVWRFLPHKFGYKGSLQR